MATASPRLVSAEYPRGYSVATPRPRRGRSVETRARLRYGLPNDELCGDVTCSTYLPSYIPLICFPECTACAGYQMAYFMKHEAPNKSDFQCCCYTTFCQNPVKP